MVKELFKDYHFILHEDGLNVEFEELQMGAFPEFDDKHRDTNGNFSYKITDFCMMRAKAFALSLFDSTEKYIETIDKSELKAFYKKYLFHFKSIEDDFLKKSSHKLLPIYQEKFLEIQLKIQERIKLEFELNNLPFIDPSNETKKIADNNIKASFSKNNEKIKWLGQINVLVTLIYDLLNGQDKNQPLIEATNERVFRLLMENFCDSDGNDFSKDTIKTYFKKGKYEKKAKLGDRIELGNVKRK